MKNLFDFKKPDVIQLKNQLFDDAGIEVWVARIDQIHKQISGNKIYKLQHYLNKAIEGRKSEIKSFGGYYSNHLHALAYAGWKLNIKTTGIIRGEKPAVLSATLLNCRDWGMHLQYTNRARYDEIKRSINTSMEDDCIVIPEGGYGKEGMLGASDIYDDVGGSRFSHIITECGTGTTVTGILSKLNRDQKIIGVSVLRGHYTLKEEISSLLPGSDLRNLIIDESHHFGGFARYNNELIQFMNHWYMTTGIPTDFVYTGKMFYALVDQIKNGFFEKGTKLLALHSGGLQGNRSLKPGVLVYDSY